MSQQLSRLLIVVLLGVTASLWSRNVLAHGVTLKVRHFLPADSPFHTQFLLPWKEKLEKESSGYLRIQIFPEMGLGGSAADLYDQAKDRTADIVWTVAAEGRFPAFEVFELPFAIYSASGASKALWEYVQVQNLAKKEFPGLRLLAVQVAAMKSRQDAGGSTALMHSKVFVLAMNLELYKSLSDEAKKVIIANSGAETSAWLGKILDDTEATALPLRNPPASATEKLLWLRTFEERIKQLDARGLDGNELIDSARALLIENDPPNKP
jgi:TRAP-type C4-dicarboxylate transport system substrate-binding protein